MKANEFLNMILEKHHEISLEEYLSEKREYSGEDESLPALSDGCEWNDIVDK
jgi:hypothetical protein